MTNELVMGIEAVVLFIAGLCALAQVFGDKNDPDKAFFLVLVGAIILIAGCLTVFRDVQLGIVAMLIGAVVVVIASTFNVKDWQTHEKEGIEEGDMGKDLVCSLIGIFCIAVSIIGYTLGAAGVFIAVLICLAIIAVCLAYVQKETIAVGIYSAAAIILFLVAFSPFIF
jgi:hypothetical protein